MYNTPTYQCRAKTIRGLEKIMMTVKQNQFMTSKQKHAHDILGRLAMKIGFEELQMEKGEQNV